MELLKNLAWRYATKKFDATQKVSEENINLLKQAIQLSASSYGLQLYKVLVISNPELKKELMGHSWNQSQLADSSHVFVLCSYNEVTDSDIDAYIQLKADKSGVEVAAIAGYGDYMKGALGARSVEDKKIWMQKQPYIALGNLLAACAELKIDACPMEGFIPEKYNEVLGLHEKGLHACLVVPVGYRSAEDATQHQPKVRRNTEDLFIEIK